MEDLTLTAAPIARRLPLGFWPRWLGGPRTAAERLSRWEPIGWAIVVGAFVVGLPLAVIRALGAGPDFWGFCDSGRFLLEHGSRDPQATLARYWPSADVPWMLICRLPLGFAAAAWYVFSAATYVGLINCIARTMLVHFDIDARRQAALTAAILGLPLALDGFFLGSFHILMLWLMIEGLERALRGKDISGGTLLGLAAWLKLLPLAGVGFLLLQRRFKSAFVAVAVAVVIDIVLSVIGYGLAGAWREHVAWWQNGATGTASHQLTSNQLEDEDRLSNQSVAITLRRWFSSLGSSPNDVRRHIMLIDLPPAWLRSFFFAVTAAMGFGLAFFLWPVEEQERRHAVPAQLALMGLATLWLSPVVWSYHFIAALPALAIIINRCRRRGRLIAVLIAVWLGSQCLLGVPVVRAAGVLLWMSVIVGVMLVTVRPPEEAVA